MTALELRERRKVIEQAEAFIEQAKMLIGQVQTDEQEAFALLSESKPQAPRGEAMDAAITALLRAVWLLHGHDRP